MLGCGTGTAPTPASSDGGIGTPQATLTCRGDANGCLSGTLAGKPLGNTFAAAKVELYNVYPYGSGQPIAAVPLALDGTFAFSNLAPGTHYYLRGVARYGSGTSAASVPSIVGPLTVPGSASIAITIRPVFLEVLQGRPTGGQTDVTWASARVYDPHSGAELTDASVSLRQGGGELAMPYGQNVGGTKSYFANLPPNTPGATSFRITTSHKALGSAPLEWNLVGEPATFDGSITTPSGPVPANVPLTVTWVAQPLASYSVTELFVTRGTTNTLVYVSKAANAPDVTTESIPSTALASNAVYLLNVNYTKATCPATADGCVYNLSTATQTFATE
jgi:hypothetical protein